MQVNDNEAKANTDSLPRSPGSRGLILGILRNERTPVSGETIAARIGVSRVAVWKSIQKLNEDGYRIASSPAGYLLEQDLPDSLYPWEFGMTGGSFRYREVTDSTMNRAREAALSGAKAGSVETAGSQTAGRGTGSRPWRSAPGNLLFTLVTRPDLDAYRLHRQVIAAQCAAARAIRSVTGKPAWTAWPNDILAPTGDGHAGKAGGILAETLVTGNSLAFVNLGIGINTGSLPPVEGTAAIRSGRRELLAAFLAEMGRLDAGESDLVGLWESLCPAVGRIVQWRPNVTAQRPAQTGAAPASPGGDTEAGDRCDRPVLSGIFTGLDGAGWAVIVPEDSDFAHAAVPDIPSRFHFYPGSISLIHKGDFA